MADTVLLINPAVADQALVMAGEIDILRQELDTDALEKDEYERIQMQLDRAEKHLGRLLAGNLVRGTEADANR